MNPHSELAKFVRAVVNMANVPSNDQFQNNLVAAKQWLDAIGAGNLLVAPPVAEDKPVAAPTEEDK